MPLPKLEGFKGAHRTMVYGIKGVRWTVNDDKSSAAAYIVECCDSQIVVSHKTAKVCFIVSNSRFTVTLLLNM